MSMGETPQGGREERFIKARDNLYRSGFIMKTDVRSPAKFTPSCVNGFSHSEFDCLGRVVELAVLARG